jgi:hypothetical protein
VPPVISAALVSSAGGRRRARYTFALGPRSGDGTSRGWVLCRLLAGSVFVSHASMLEARISILQPLGRAFTSDLSNLSD